MPEIVPHLISTIIPVYNRAEMVKSAVNSVLAQDYRPIEIIIVDDGSTDGTSAVCKQLAAEYEGVVHALSQVNHGPGPARELGRLCARGEFIQYLDSDDRLLPSKFTLQVAALRARSDCGVAYGYTRLIDATGNILRAPFKWTAEDRDTLFPGLLVDRWWCTHTPLYRSSVTDKVGPWSELHYSQDWEYDARVGALGTRLVNCHGWVSEHRQHDSLRQTGDGMWLAPQDRLQFFSALHRHAQEAGVPLSTPEMRHFSRWVFRHARECGLLGETDVAQELLALARDAAGPHARDITGYEWLVRVIGWRTSARLAATARTLMSRSRGPYTQGQSWMN